MRKTEIQLIYSYIYKRKTALENEVIQRQSNLRFREVDIVDCMELANAITQRDSFIEWSNHILALLNLKK